jgi:polyisoprenoid-binding protein YceI
MKYLCALFIAMLVMMGNAPVSRAAEKFRLDKNHTVIEFDVSYLLLARVHGRFDEFAGSFVIDRDHPAQSRADIAIQTASVNTGNQNRDADISGPRFFNSAHYPTMVFHSNNVTIYPDNSGQITGDLTLLGVTQSVTLDLLSLPGTDKNMAGGFEVAGKIKRSDFGMNKSALPVGNIVTLRVCYNLATCPASRHPRRAATSRYND